MNNIGAVLSALPSVDRIRVAEALGFLMQAPEAFQTLARAGNSGPTDVNIEAVDSAVEGLFRRTLEVEGTHRWALNNLGLHLHWRSRNEEVSGVGNGVEYATVVYRRVLKKLKVEGVYVLLRSGSPMDFRTTLRAGSDGMKIKVTRCIRSIPYR